MKTYLIKNAQIINEGKIFASDVLIKDGRIEKIAPNIAHTNQELIDAQGKYLIPGMIDDQVHFREPGLTHKGNIYSESRAALAGGITSFMEMPNTSPQTLTQELLEEKYAIAKQNSLANYSFFMGVSNHNLEEALKTNKSNVCGLKVFMGSSTGDMLVDDEHVLNNLFSKSELLIATHCEDEATIKANLKHYTDLYGENIPFSMHPKIRSAEACYKSSSLAVQLAKKHGTRLHILHISTAKEIELFSNSLPTKDKKITAEACIHHLWFSDDDYKDKGANIKWNPAVKSAQDREAIIKAVLEDKIDIIATDHAPHTIEEKTATYLKAPSGGPLVQHALPALFEMYHQGKISLEKIVDKTSHKVAECFQIKERGYIREGYWADLALVDLNSLWMVEKSNILYKCGWSPFEGTTFNAQITHTFVNGTLVYENNKIIENNHAQRLEFLR